MLDNLNSKIDWLAIEKNADSIAAKPQNGFSKIENSGSTRWIWGILGKTTLNFPQEISGTVYYTFVIPEAGTTVEIHFGNNVVKTMQSNRPWQEISGKAAYVFSPTLNLHFKADRWNGQPNSFAPEDSRPISLLFKTLFFEKLPEQPLQVKAKKICAYPFSKMEIYSPNFAPCCTWWLEEKLGFEGNEGDPWNCKSAQALRRSVLNGTYEFCKLDICRSELFLKEDLEQAAAIGLPISANNLVALRSNLTHLPEGPSSVVILSDPRCNLACPSCRKDFIRDLTAQEAEQLQETERLLRKYQQSLTTLVFASNGEVFYSPFLREQLKKATQVNFPNLESVEIISNGILFDQKTYDQLRPGSLSIRKACISMDAGNRETYEKVRGADWDRLLKNLCWLKELRSNGTLQTFRLNFVTQKENFHSLPEFFQLADRLGVDEVFISRALPWTSAKFDISSQDIFQPQHPDYPAMNNLWNELSLKPWPFKILGNVGSFVQENQSIVL